MVRHGGGSAEVREACVRRVRCRVSDHVTDVFACGQLGQPAQSEFSAIDGSHSEKYGFLR